MPTRAERLTGPVQPSRPGWDVVIAHVNVVIVIKLRIQVVQRWIRLLPGKDWTVALLVHEEFVGKKKSVAGYSPVVVADEQHG